MKIKIRKQNMKSNQRKWIVKKRKRNFRPKKIKGGRHLKFEDKQKRKKGKMIKRKKKKRKLLKGSFQNKNLIKS